MEVTGTDIQVVSFWTWNSKIAEELRSAVYEETGLTCCAGLVPNRLLAKTENGDFIDCKDINKQLALDNPLLKDYKIQIMGGLDTVTKKAHNIMQEVAVNLAGPCLLTPRCMVPILLLKMEVFACSNRLHVFEAVYQV